MPDAQVVCRQLGFETSSELYHSYNINIIIKVYDDFVHMNLVNGVTINDVLLTLF